mgnify:FL=1
MTMKQRLPEKTSFLHYTANEVADNVQPSCKTSEMARCLTCLLVTLGLKNTKQIQKRACRKGCSL